MQLENAEQAGVSKALNEGLEASLPGEPGREPDGTSSRVARNVGQMPSALGGRHHAIGQRNRTRQNVRRDAQIPRGTTSRGAQAVSPILILQVTEIARQRREAGAFATTEEAERRSDVNPSDAARVPRRPSLTALLEAVVTRGDRQALNDLVGSRPVFRLANGNWVTIIEYIIARCTGREGHPLPRSVDRELVYDLLIDRFYMLPDEVIP